MKKMLNNVAKSSMSYDSLMNNIVYGIFDDEGLYEQAMKLEKAEYEALIVEIKRRKLWEMNMKLPADCKNESCPHVNKWIRAKKGVNIAAANLKNFQPDSENVTLSEFND